MAKTTAATEQDRLEVARLVLGGMARDEPPHDVLMQLRSFADYSFPFPGDVLTELGAAALAGRGCGSDVPRFP